MRNVVIKIFLSMLLSSAVMADSFKNESFAQSAQREEVIFVIPTVDLLGLASESFTNEYKVSKCVFLKPVFDLFQRDVGFDLEKFDFTLGLFAEYRVNKVFNLFADYDFIRDRDFDYMVFGMRYSF